MFTDYTSFSSDLLDFCIENGLTSDLLDCMDSGPVDESVAWLREKLRVAHGLTVDSVTLVCVCRETGAWDDLDSVSDDTLMDRAIFCSLPSEEDLWVELCRREFDDVKSTGTRRAMLRSMCIKIDNL
jgi:hypothetical protein